MRIDLYFYNELDEKLSEKARIMIEANYIGGEVEIEDMGNSEKFCGKLHFSKIPNPDGHTPFISCVEAIDDSIDGVLSYLIERAWKYFIGRVNDFGMEEI